MDSILFYLFSGLIVFTAIKTISHKNPAFGALYLALSMILLAGIFFLMGAPFLAGIQLIIYAGAVMVLFVMVLMLFDFKKEVAMEFKNISWILPALLLGLVFGLISLMAFSSLPSPEEDSAFLSAGELALKLFIEYVLIFEMIGFLLLLIAIGVVAIARLDKD